MTIGRRWSVAAAVLPLLVLGACSQDPEPTFSPPSETPSASESTETSAAPSPEPWEEKSVKGAVAFAEHWIDEFSKAMHTLDPSTLRGLSSPTCELCTQFAERLDAISQRGGSYESKGWRVLEVSVAADLPQDQATVVMRILQGAERFREAKDDELVQNERSKATWSTDLVWEAERWMLTDLRLVE